jgi:hypothetical protein
MIRGLNPGMNKRFFIFSGTSRRILESTLPPIQYAQGLYSEGKAAEA